MNIQNQFKRMALMGLIMLSTLNLMSQKGQGSKKEDKGAKHEKMKVLFKQYLNDKLALTETEKKGFWPIFDEYKKKEKELKDSFRKKYKPNSIPFMDDKQAEAYLNDFFQLNENINQLYKETTIKLKKVIPIKKVAMIPHTEREFKKELLKKMREKGQAPPPPDEE
jgi:hypothetical protein